MVSNNAKQKKATVHTLSCRLNQSESQIIREKLEEAGYCYVPFGDRADLAVINTCTVTREADAKSRQAIRQFIRANPLARVRLERISADFVEGSLVEVLN
jgi:threonylcarbamoyladenosine tRNA methylthiotransferase MtaB